MKNNFLKVGAFILVLAPAVSMGTQDSFNKIDEFLLWGSYYKFKKNTKSTYTSNSKESDGSGEEEEKPVLPIPDPIAVVKEDNVIKAWKENAGDRLYYTVSNDIFSTDKAALWLTDLNTEVVNDKILDSTFTGTGAENFSVEAEENAVFINNGTVAGTHGGIRGKSGAEIQNNNIIENAGDYGIYLENGNAHNSGTGIISSTGDYGIFAATENSTAANSGVIENTGNYGMAANGGEITNNAGGVIKNGMDFGMYSAGNSSSALNKGVIENIGNYGMLSESGAKSVNEGTVKNSGNIGMGGSGLNSTVINDGIVENTGDTGINLTGGAKGTNNGTVRNTGDYGAKVLDNSYFENNSSMENTGMYGIYADSDSEILNNTAGIVQNNGDYGIAVLNTAGTSSKASNKGTVKNAGDYGMYAEWNNAVIENGGTIENTGTYGMYAVSGAKAQNTAGGIVKNSGDTGMAADGLGSIAINNGSVENTGNNGFYISNYAEGTNSGIIRNTGDYGIRTINYSYAVNSGTIANTGTNGMFVTGNSEALNDTSGIIENQGNYGIAVASGSKAENKGIVKNDGMSGIYVINGGLGINSGTIENTSTYGIYTTAVNSKGINYGTIKNDGTHGMYATTNSEVLNDSTGIIENTGNYGIVAGSNSLGTNNGIIKNQGTNGMYTTNAGTIINNGRIENTGTYGMQATGAGSQAVNGLSGVIANNGNSGLYGINGAHVVNKGTIKNTGDYGMHLNNATGINEGTIYLTGDNKIGVHINNNAVFINNGIIRVDGNNVTGIKAMGNSVVQIAQNSQIILNGNAAVTQGNTDYSDKQSTGAANSNSAGKAYNIDSTSTLVNAGTISAYGTFTVEETGKFVLDTKTGTINADSVDLAGDLYVNAAGTTDSFSDKFTLRNLNTEKVEGEGSLISDSLLFTGKLEKNSSGKYDIVMERKDFSEVFSSEFGKILEENYSETGDIEGKNKIYNSLKVSVTSKDRALTAENELTGRSIVSNLMYQEFNRNRVLENGVNDLLENRDRSADKGVYVNILGGKEDSDNDGDFLGYKNREAGVIFGMMKKINNKISAGGFAGYLSSDIDYKDDGNSNQKTDTLSLKGALEIELTDGLRWRNILGYNYGNTDTKRKLTYDKSYTELNGNFDSWSARIDTNLEYTYDVNKRISVIPLVGLNVSYLHQNSYNESGAAGYNLRVDSASGTSVRPKAGIRADLGLYENNNTKLKLVPSVLYSYETANPYKVRNIGLEAFDNAFFVESRDSERGNLDLGIGLEYNYNRELVFYGQYKKEVLNDSGNDKMSLGFKVYF
ncbi:autotransporter outer membrane beta-barrel domain-containing protein [Sebaldella sp. S0638]|uniref:autotransporter outer membrane beta-barrel domain-containing protein n=1 Tax=Sebaldella sp. S0638 TaxID=2957809 RepID=UPI00209E2DCF|nr:autotransporter outer membrane beta-barrel domain-containing protein [Sebaldella sp. S0638]MCP1223271.1 autotransporter domain-containing protein [Sebaldella sp. S0638]